MACGIRYRDDVNVVIQCTEMVTAYSEVASLLFEHLQPARLEPGWLDSLLDAFKRCPDPEYLRTTIPTVLSRQRLSPDEMVDLISKAPKEHTPARPLGFGFTPHTIEFCAIGGALYESLVGPVLPIFPETVERRVRVPDWAYLSYNVRGRPSLALNLNKECGCYECTQATSSCTSIEPAETPEM